jgi:integrase
VKGSLNWDSPVEPSSFYRWVFRPAVKRAGIPNKVRLHDLRHTYASLMLTAGMSPYWICEQMGHSSYVITMTTYARLIRERDESSAHPAEDRLAYPATPATGKLCGSLRS